MTWTVHVHEGAENIFRPYHLIVVGVSSTMYS